MKIYVAGPMRGKPNLNFDTFNNVTALLRKVGHFVMNPAETDGQSKVHPLKYYFALDVAMLLVADAIVMLPGWTKSRLAPTEHKIAHATGLQIFYWSRKHDQQALLEDSGDGR